MSVNIVGLSCFYHDSAVAVVQDGEITFAAQEERFSRVKNDSRFPSRALATALKVTGLDVSDIDHVAYYENPWTKFSRVLQGVAERSPRGFADFSRLFARWSRRQLVLNEALPSLLGDGFRGRIHCSDHHAAHAASCFFPSPFENAAFLIQDAVGEWACSSVGTGKGSRIELLEEMRFPHSLGMLYSAFTYFTGFDVNEGEYKLMGLAPYGRPRFADLIKDKVVRITDSGAVHLNLDYFEFVRGRSIIAPALAKLLGMARREPSDPINQSHMDVAASIQAVAEEAILNAAIHAHRLTGMRDLCMAGGVALNCVANGRIQREGPFERIWIQPAAGDAGGALGAALLVWHETCGKARSVRPSDSQQGSLLGWSFSNTEICVYLDAIGAKYHYVQEEEELLKRVAELLAKEHIIGWFQSKMEFGPRALGSRSILGDARPADMQYRMNKSIKFRESFRPFAPAVLRDHVSTIFEVPATGVDSPYMLFVAPVKEAWRLPIRDEDRASLQSDDIMKRLAVCRSKLQSITHVDYSARLQSVDEERHGRYYRLISRFHQMTGVPVIVNTSFNVAGEPIVATPEDAFHCFMKTDIDVLVMENALLFKAEQPAGLKEHIVGSF